MQPLHLHPNMQVRHQAQGLRLRPVVQVRLELRLRELTATRRSVLPPPQVRLSPLVA